MTIGVGYGPVRHPPIPIVATLGPLLKGNIIQWTVSNKLALNKSKTKQIVFGRPSARLSILPAPVLDIEIVESLKLLGVFVSSTFNQAEHVNFVCCIANQHLYLLNIFKENGLNCNSLD